MTWCVICNKFCPNEGLWKADSRMGGWFHSDHTEGEKQLYLLHWERKNVMKLISARPETITS